MILIKNGFAEDGSGYRNGGRFTGLDVVKRVEREEKKMKGRI